MIFQVSSAFEGFSRIKSHWKSNFDQFKLLLKLADRLERGKETLFQVSGSTTNPQLLTETVTYNFRQQKAFQRTERAPYYVLALAKFIGNQKIELAKDRETGFYKLICSNSLSITCNPRKQKNKEAIMFYTSLDVEKNHENIKKLLVQAFDFGLAVGIIDNKETRQYSENFLEEIVEDLKIKKNKKLANAESSEINMQLMSLFGKSFDDNEIEELVDLENELFEKKIKNKFKKSRDDRIKLLNHEQYNEIEKNIFLQLIDQNWKMHIQYLEQLRQVIGLRSFGQRDPLVEYKKEAFALFENLLRKIKYDLITILFNLKIVEKNEEEKQKDENINKKFAELSTKKIGRNEPCPCNSGKKYKHCHGAL